MNAKRKVGDHIALSASSIYRSYFINAKAKRVSEIMPLSFLLFFNLAPILLAQMLAIIHDAE
jgi:hypothetical protein